MTHYSNPLTVDDVVAILDDEAPDHPRYTEAAQLAAFWLTWTDIRNVIDAAETR